MAALKELVTQAKSGDLKAYDRIAAFLEIPATTVNNRLNAARKRLKKEILNMATENLQSLRETASLQKKCKTI